MNWLDYSDILVLLHELVGLFRHFGVFVLIDWIIQTFWCFCMNWLDYSDILVFLYEKVGLFRHFSVFV